MAQGPCLGCLSQALCGRTDRVERDRITLAPATEHWNGMSVYGFETRTVRDTALLLDLTAQRAPQASYSAAASSPPAALRIAITTRSPWPFPTAGPVRRALDETAELVRGLGHRVERGDPPFGMLSNAITALYLRGPADDAREMSHPERLQRRTRGFARLGGLVPDGMVRWAKGEGQAFAERSASLFREFDALLTPISTRPPVKAGRWEGLGALPTLLGLTATFPFNVAWNLTGQPAASIRGGTSDDGLPIGVQLVGRPDDEATLLSLAAQIEAERGWPDHRPPVS